MRQVFGWLLVMLLGCATSGRPREQAPDTRLLEAQTDLDAATALKDAGKYSEALTRAEHALALREAVLGGTHPDVATCLNLLGELHWQQGHPAQAESFLQRALAVREAVLGPNHLEVARSLNSLARLYLFQQRLTDALPLYTRALALSEQRLRHEALDFSGSRLSHLFQYLRFTEETIYSLPRVYLDDARVHRLALSVALLLKGRSIEEAAQLSHALNRELGAEDRDAFERLRGVHTQLASLSLSGPGSLSSEAYQRRRQTLTDEANKLEAELAQRSMYLRARSALPSLDEVVERVTASLPRDGALVEFVAYRDGLLVQPPGPPSVEHDGPLRYLALVLFPDASTRAVDLGPAEPIDDAASRLRTAVARPDSSFLATAQTLHRLVFMPLLPLLGHTRRLWIAPEGQLGLVPFAALHDGQGFLLDSFHFTYLASGRELLPRPQAMAPSCSVVVFADPDFSAPAPLSSPARDPVMEPLERFFSSTRGVQFRNALIPLPGTRQEARDIQRRLPQAQLFLGPEATKQRLLQLPTPGVLHLATHSFFLESSSPAAPSNVRAVQWDAADDAALMTRVLQQPLLRSGIVLAGARAPAPESSVRAESSLSSSVATALELSGLNLWGTQLVVLSACKTGWGEVRVGQGIHGLRSSLLVAGAETVVVSLWNVNDDSTRLLMDNYYRHLLAGEGRASALREAMRSLRATHPHPSYWAPFIALGSDAPLRELTCEAVSR